MQSPLPSGIYPSLECGRIAFDVCKRAAALARAAHEADVRGATTIVVDDDCASLPTGCAHRQPFDVIVVFAAGDDTTGWLAYEVTGPAPSTPTTVGSLNLGAPAKVARRLAPSQPVVTSPDPVVDTWVVGRAVDCKAVKWCGEFTKVGLAGLDKRDKGHAPVVSTSLHGYGTPVDAHGHPILYAVSGGMPEVLVVVLRDGSTHAIGVGRPGGFIAAAPIAFTWWGTPPPGRE
jgi:hypothetical protein